MGTRDEASDAAEVEAEREERKEEGRVGSGWRYEEFGLGFDSGTVRRGIRQTCFGDDHSARIRGKGWTSRLYHGPFRRLWHISSLVSTINRYERV